MLQRLQYMACTSCVVISAVNRRVCGRTTQHSLTAKLAVTEAIPPAQLTPLTSVEMPFPLNSTENQRRRRCFQTLTKRRGLSWQGKGVSTSPRAGLYKIHLPAVASLFEVYLEMAIVQMMHTHVTLLCPPPQQQVWALLGGGSCRAICSSPSPRRRSRWLSKIILSMEML